jgi:glyoxylase-like metal-dependent hydrolase (beta-lactamase superfamily II)
MSRQFQAYVLPMARRVAKEGGCDIFELGELRLARVALGPYQTNCYVLWNGQDRSDCWLIDASFEPQPILDLVARHALTPKALILTHAHIDHIAGVREIRRVHPKVDILIHQLEEAWLTDPLLNLSSFTGQAVTSPQATRALATGESLELAGATWKVLHTPGHSPGSITLSCPPLLAAIVGDALFAGSIGRTDFPGCSFELLERSIREHLYTLNPETTFFPGHGSESTIGKERRSNPFVHD